MSNQNLNKQTADTQDKSYRIAAILIALASVVAFFLPLKVWMSGTIEHKALFGILSKMSDSTYKMYGLLPILGDSASAFNRLYSYVVYAFLLTLIFAFVVAVVAVILTKKSAILSKVATYVFTWSVAIYSLTITCFTSYVNTVKISFDVSTMILAIIGALTYFFLMYKENGHKSWVNAVQFLLSLTVIALFMLAITHYGSVIAESLNKKTAYKSLVALAAAGLFFALAATTLCVFHKKFAYLSLAFALFQSLIILCVVLLGQTAKINEKHYAIYLLVAAVISFVQILVACLLVLEDNKKTARKDFDVFIGEVAKSEYVEVVPYDGTPVAGVYVAEMVEEEPATPVEAPAPEAPVAPVAPVAPAQTEAPAEAPAAPAEAPAPAPAPAPVFDAFIASLSDEERMQFTDLYILKTVSMPEIPTYEVGGNNKSFFNKVFIYIGQYRDKIPSGLLAKMYDFSAKA